MRRSAQAVELSRRLKAVLWTDTALALLPDCGWIDGGCAILALALQRLGEVGDLTGVWQVGPWHGNFCFPTLQHVVLQVGPYYLDGDGVSAGKVLLDRWRKRERLQGAYLEAFGASQFQRQVTAAGIPAQPVPAARVVRYLQPILSVGLMRSLALGPVVRARIQIPLRPFRTRRLG
jgi:hypothetical protein